MAEKVKQECPNCGKKDTLWSKVNFLYQEDIDFINQYHEPKQEVYCHADNCGFILLSKYKNVWDTERAELMNQLQALDVNVLPVISLPNPQGWEYEIIELVTAQTTTGTGAFTEISSQLADLMGNQSEGHNDKILTAINNCKQQLRNQTLKLEGNAVIGCDIDITTGGTGNGLIMLCMSGTAIRVKNVEVFRKDVQSVVSSISELQIKITELNKRKYTY